VETVLSLRVYVADTDFSGLVYHANYVKFFEAARVEHLRNLGFSLNKMFTNSKISFVVHKLSLTYSKPAKLEDELSIITKIIQCKRCSLRYQQKIIRPADDALICSAVVDVATVDEHTKPVAMPKYLRQEILG